MEVPRGCGAPVLMTGAADYPLTAPPSFTTMIPDCGDAGRMEIAMPTRRKYPLAALCLSAFSLSPQPSFAQSPSESQNATILDEVVVTASRIQEIKREVSSNVTIITSEDIKASTATSVANLLVQNGFHVAKSGDTSNIQVRGMGGLSMPMEHENQVLILLNGRRIGMSNLALAGLANVERVEIIRGPSAVQYGSSAMGGVVNIITRRGDTTKEPFASVELGIGSDSLKRKTVAFGGAANGFDFAFGGTHFSHDEVTVKGGRRWFHTEVDKDLTYNVDLGYTFNKNHRVRINFNQVEVKSELPDAMGGIRPYSGNTPDGDYTKHLKRNTNTAFSYTGATEAKNLDWVVNYSFGSDKQKGTSTDPWTGTYQTIVDNKVFNTQLNYHTSIFTLSSGVDRYQYDVSGYADGTEMAVKDTGAYLTGKLRLLNERLIFSLGLRHDKYENSSTVMRSQKDSHTGGSAGVSYLPTNWLKLRANYADGFKTPSPMQVGGYAPWYYISNPSLKPEQSKTWEFGADVNWNNANASLTYFHSDWKNKIIGMRVDPNDPMNWDSQFQNLKKSEVAGVEGSLGWNLGKVFRQNYSLTPYANFTWLTTRKNKDESQFIDYQGAKNDTLPNVPKWMASYGIHYAHPGLKVKSRLNANYYGKTYTMDYSNGFLLAGYISRPSGTVVNWSLEKGLADFGKRYGNLTLRTEVNNLFDKANEMKWGYPGSGRSFYVGLRYDF